MSISNGPLPISCQKDIPFNTHEDLTSIVKMKAVLFSWKFVNFCPTIFLISNSVSLFILVLVCILSVTSAFKPLTRLDRVAVNPPRMKLTNIAQMIKTCYKGHKVSIYRTSKTYLKSQIGLPSHEQNEMCHQLEEMGIVALWNKISLPDNCKTHNLAQLILTCFGDKFLNRNTIGRV